jgi:hypothetical protein
MLDLAKGSSYTDVGWKKAAKHDPLPLSINAFCADQAG